MLKGFRMVTFPCFVISLLLMSGLPFSLCQRYEDAHWDRMMAVRQEVQAKDCVVLLQELVDGSKGNIAAVTRMTCLTPAVIQRLLDGVSSPTRVTEISIRAVAEDYYFYHRHFWLLDLSQDWKWRTLSYWPMNLPYVTDPFLNLPQWQAENYSGKALIP